MKTTFLKPLTLGVAGAFALSALWQNFALQANNRVLATKATQTPAPELVGNQWLNTAGKPTRLAERRGKVTVVEFWTFACSNCRANLPAYTRLHRKFAPRGVAVIGVHTPETDAERDPKNVAREVKKLGITYPILLDTNHENWNRWKQQYWPTIYVLDKNGVVRSKWEGELASNGARGEAKIAHDIEQLLAEPTKKHWTVEHTDAQWRKILSAEQYHVLREEGTEAPFTGALWNEHGKGEFHCAACDNLLFTSNTKFESGTGWPSFWKPANASSVFEQTDVDGSRTEVLCAQCGSHLGHVFDDGPKPTGLRYCMNSVAMKFVKKS